MKESPIAMLWPVLILILIVALLAGCAVARVQSAATAIPPAQTRAGSTGDATPWPTEDWETDNPAAHNVDAARLNAMVDYIRLKGLDIRGLVVVRDSYIVFEHYEPNQDANSRAEVFSVTKSFASTLVGIAQRKGLLTDLDAPMLSLLPGEYRNVDAAKQAMTLEDVLTMRAGLAWDDDMSIEPFYMAPNQVQYMLDLPMATEPGTQFNYCSGCSQLLTAAVGKATGMTPQAFAEQELFGPLGIQNPRWLTDRQGIALGGWGLQLSAREMAKLGYLFLRGGEWDGEQIVTREWVQAATKRHTDTDSSIGSGYGYQWWTHPKNGAYMALGRGGQMVYVRPDKDLVVSIRAQLPNHDAIYYLIDTYIEPAVK